MSRWDNPSNTSGCPISLKQGANKRVLKPVHQCKVVKVEIDYQLQSAASSSLAAPCTNRPVRCKHCEQVIASYSMRQHYSDKHANVTMPVDLEQDVELAKHEREHVMQKLTKHGKVENVCPGTS